MTTLEQLRNLRDQAVAERPDFNPDLTPAQSALGGSLPAIVNYAVALAEAAEEMQRVLKPDAMGTLWHASQEQALGTLRAALNAWIPGLQYDEAQAERRVLIARRRAEGREDDGSVGYG